MCVRACVRVCVCLCVCVCVCMCLLQFHLFVYFCLRSVSTGASMCKNSENKWVFEKLWVCVYYVVGGHPNRRITRFSVKFSILRFSIISIVDIPLNILWNYQFLIWCNFCVIITFIESCYKCHFVIKKLLFPIDARVKRQRVTGLCQIRQFGWPRAQCARSSKLSYQGTLTLRVILVIRQFAWLRALCPQSSKPSYRGEMITVFADRKNIHAALLRFFAYFLTIQFDENITH